MDVEEGPSLPFGFVKVEPETNEPDLSNALNDVGIAPLRAELAGLTIVSAEDVPNAVVEVSLSLRAGSLDAYQDVSKMFPSAPEVIDLEDDAQLAALARGMKNDKAKVKNEGMPLPELMITKYIKFFGLCESGTPKDDESRQVMDQTVRREFLSNTYGGNPQELYSVPKAERVAEHGHRVFVCPMLSIHPWAPQMPGFPGLVFTTRPKCNDDPWIEDVPFICMAGLRPGKWLYVGHYIWKGHGWLTKDEWRSLSHSVKRDWINYIVERPWGISVRMSIRLRRRLGRDPSRVEVSRECARFEKGGPLDDVTAEEVMEAFNQGKEERHLAILVTGLNCEYYDFELQREFVEKQEEWYTTDAGRKYAVGDGPKPKRKRKAEDTGAARRPKKRKQRRQPSESSLSVKDEEVSEYDADKTPPPTREIPSVYNTRGRNRARTTESD